MLEWQYVANPSGKLLVDFALAPEPNRVAAIYATLPVRLRVGGEVTLGVQSVDTITDVDFRGQGLFLELAESVYARATREGARLVYGFPNGSSAHGFFQRLQWQRLDPVPFLIRPLRTSYVLERLGFERYSRLVPDVRLHSIAQRGSRRVEEIRRFDDRATRLWDAFSTNIGVAVERDARYLNWRLIDKPHEAYVSEGVCERDELVAFVSHVVKAKHGGRIGYVMEALCRPGRELVLRGLLDRALANMTREGADVALAWCMPHARPFRAFVSTGFVPFPVRFRPIELHFGARAFSNNSRVAKRAEWYVSYLDSDTT